MFLRVLGALRGEYVSSHALIHVSLKARKSGAGILFPRELVRERCTGHRLAIDRRVRSPGVEDQRDHLVTPGGGAFMVELDRKRLGETAPAQIHLADRGVA